MTNKKLLIFALPLVIFLIGFISAVVSQTPGAVVNDNYSESITNNVSQIDETAHQNGESFSNGFFLGGISVFVVVILAYVISKISKKKKRKDKAKPQDIEKEPTKSDQDEPQDQGDVNKPNEEKKEEPIDKETDELMSELGLEEKGEQEENERLKRVVND